LRGFSILIAAAALCGALGLCGCSSPVATDLEEVHVVTDDSNHGRIQDALWRELLDYFESGNLELKLLREEPVLSEDASKEYFVWAIVRDDDDEVAREGLVRAAGTASGSFSVTAFVPREEFGAASTDLSQRVPPDVAEKIRLRL
jgi:hypothetical protein